MGESAKFPEKKNRTAGCGKIRPVMRLESENSDSALIGNAVDGDVCGGIEGNLGSVEGIILSVKNEAAAVEVDGTGTLHAVIEGIHGHGAAVEIDRGHALYGFVFGIDFDGTAVDIHVADHFVFVIGGLDTVADGVDLNGAVIDNQIVLALDAVFGCSQIEGTAVDFQSVLGVDCGSVVGVDGEGAGALNGQVFLGVERGIGFILIGRRECVLLAVHEGIGGAFLEGKDCFGCLGKHDAGAVVVGDIGIVKHQFNRTGVNGIDLDHAVVKGTGDDICTVGIDGNSAVLAHIDGRSIGGSGRAVQGNMLGVGGFFAGSFFRAGNHGRRQQNGSQKEGE